MKNFKKTLTIILSVILIATMLTACGASKEFGNMSDVVMEGATPEFDGDFGFVDNMASDKVSGSGNDNNTGNTNKEDVTTNRKIIEKYRMTIETKEFDNLLPKIKEKVDALGGYIESSSIDNGRYSRSAYYTIRIPQSVSDTFNAFISENSNVTHSETDTTDVTLTYVDIQSRIASYKAEKLKLEELMANATNLSDVLAIQDRLTDVIYQIESYESKLRTYDNLIDFTTVDLTIREVEKETVVEELTIWEEIKMNLEDGFENVGNFLVGLFVWLISAIPYFLLIGGFSFIVFLIILVGRKCTKKQREKRESEIKKANEENAKNKK